MQASTQRHFWVTLLISVVLYGLVTLVSAVSWPAQFAVAGGAFVLAGVYSVRCHNERWLMTAAIFLIPWVFDAYLVVSDGLLHAIPNIAVVPAGMSVGVLAARASRASGGLIVVASVVVLILGGVTGVPSWLSYVENNYQYSDGRYVRTPPNAHELSTTSIYETLPLVGESGEMVIPEFWTGRTIVLDFWTTDCGACYTRFPEVERFADRTEGVDVYAVHLPQRIEGKVGEDRRMGRARYAAGGHGLPVVYSEATYEEVSGALGFVGVPAMAVIDRGGDVRYVGHPKAGRFALVENLGKIVDDIRR